MVATFLEFNVLLVCLYLLGGEVNEQSYEFTVAGVTQSGGVVILTCQHTTNNKQERINLMENLCVVE